MPDSAPTAPEQPPPTPGPLRRTLAIVRRPRVAIPAIAVVLAGVDVGLVLAMGGWKAEVAKLEDTARDLGNRVASVEAMAAGQRDELALLEVQSEAASEWIPGLESAAAIEQARTDELRQLVLDLQKCADDRAVAIASYWSGSSAAAAQESAATAECSVVLGRVDAVLGGA